MSAPEARVIVALDYAEAGSALSLVSRLDPSACAVKVGKELFTAAGPQLVRDLVARGFRVFLDLKFHDIPNTVAHACAAATRLGAWMINVHASGGPAMLVAAREAVTRTAAEANMTPPMLIAVTVLTSMTAEDLRLVGVPDAPDVQVLRLAKLARMSGLDGVVCSAREAAALRASCGPDFKLVTPGIRLPGAVSDDQVRVMTPEAAVSVGSDYLVIGRPITAAPDPLRVLHDINASLGVTA